MHSSELSPVEYLDHVLARADRYQVSLGAFITVFGDQAREGALAAERAISSGEVRPLTGLPVSVKDVVWTKGQRTTMGSALFSDFVPEKDSVCIERIREAGGIVFAKANTPEFAMNRRSVNLVSDEALNPWDTTRSSGGSSGGSAVATAAGLGPVSIGTDGGGSIRIPSSFNGVFGIHPSRGRVADGARFFESPMSGIGPITRDVRDAALFLQIMAGHDIRDPFSMRESVPDYLSELEEGVDGVRIAWSSDLGRNHPESADVVSLCHDAARTFRDAEAKYDEPIFRFEDPFDPLQRDAVYSPERLRAEFEKTVPGYDDVFSWAAKLPADQRAKLAIYMRDRTDRPTRLEYAMTIDPAVRRRQRTTVAELFTEYDLLVTPTSGRYAFECTEQGITPPQYTAYTYIVNVSGFCAASVPVGFVDGMPIGLQIIGRPNEEALVLRASRVLERARPWAQHRPPSVA